MKLPTARFLITLLVLGVLSTASEAQVTLDWVSSKKGRGNAVLADANGFIYVSSGVDLVKLQLRLAAGDPLPFGQKELVQRGHAIECRIYAEDPANNFLPDIGCVLYAVEPQGPGIRVDAGVTSGNEITLHYDPMIAKLIVHGQNRPDAIRKMSWALKQHIILGVTTNIPFLQDVISHQAFNRGQTTTDFVETYFARWQPSQTTPPDLVLAAAAISELVDDTSGPGNDESTAAREDDPYSPWQQSDRFRMGQ